MTVYTQRLPWPTTGNSVNTLYYKTWRREPATGKWKQILVATMAQNSQWYFPATGDGFTNAEQILNDAYFDLQERMWANPHYTAASEEIVVPLFISGSGTFSPPFRALIGVNLEITNYPIGDSEGKGYPDRLFAGKFGWVNASNGYQNDQLLANFEYVNWKQQLFTAPSLMVGCWWTLDPGVFGTLLAINYNENVKIEYSLDGGSSYSDWTPGTQFP